MNLKVISFISGIVFFILWDKVFHNFILSIFLDFSFIPDNISYIFVNLIPFIILFEFVTKALMLSTISSKLEITTTQLETIEQVDHDRFSYYTSALDSLGFIKLTDIQLSESVVTVARLFTHPKYQCFVEVIQTLGKDYILCAIGSNFEKEWSISSRDQVHQTTAISYAFLRRPKSIVIYKPGATPQELLDSHLELRQKMMRDLDIELLPLTSLEDYLEQGRQSRIQQKQRLWRKSIIFCMVEMWLFSLKSPEQKYQWLGDYTRLARRKNHIY